jgi:uncharacterized Zn-finger protein
MDEVQGHLQDDLNIYDMTNSESKNVQETIPEIPQTPIFDLTNPSDVYPFCEEKISIPVNEKKDEISDSPEELSGRTGTTSIQVPTVENGINSLLHFDFKALSFPPHLAAMIESMRDDPQTQIIIVPVLIPRPLLQPQHQTQPVPLSTPVPSPDSKHETEVPDYRSLWNCSECNMIFKSKFSLTRHRKTHTKEKPYKCAFCPKAFAEKSSRKRHVQTHSGQKPWKCNICDKSFADKVNLRRHMGKQH